MNDSISFRPGELKPFLEKNLDYRNNSISKVARDILLCYFKDIEPKLIEVAKICERKEGFNYYSHGTSWGLLSFMMKILNEELQNDKDDTDA